MRESPNLKVPFISSVFHPTDFSEGSKNAFAHALAIALLRKTGFTILHVGAGDINEEWTQFPPVRATLERWGLLQKGSPRSAVFEKLGVKVQKIDVRGRSPLATTLDYLEEYPTDLIVLATEGREGLPRWIHPSTAERLARKSRTMTLFVPKSTRGFVSLTDGEISLKKILIPVDHRPSPASAIAYATRAATFMGDPPVEITVMHVGDSTEMPRLDLPEAPTYSWKKLHLRGEVVEEIIRVVEEHFVDLVAMATHGHEGILDALRGSVTEHVLRRSPCPVLAVPAD